MHVIVCDFVCDLDYGAKPLVSCRGSCRGLQWWHTPLIPGVRQQRQRALFEFKATLGYKRLNQSRREIGLKQRWSRHLGSMPLIPALGGDRQEWCGLGLESNRYKAEGDRSSGQFEDSVWGQNQDHPLGLSIARSKNSSGSASLILSFHPDSWLFKFLFLRSIRIHVLTVFETSLNVKTMNSGTVKSW